MREAGRERKRERKAEREGARDQSSGLKNKKEAVPLVSKNLVSALWGHCRQTTASCDPKISSIFSGSLIPVLLAPEGLAAPMGHEKCKTPSVQVKCNKILFTLETSTGTSRVISYF